MVPRTSADAAVVPIPRRRFTIDEYHRMGEAGVLTEDDRVELLNGEIVQMSPIGSPHASTVARSTGLLVRRFGKHGTMKAETIDVHRRPALRGYREHHTCARGRTITPLAFPRLRIRVNEVLG